LIICGDYNITNAFLSHDNLGLTALGTLRPSAIVLADSFSFLNLFRRNSEYNRLGGLLRLIYTKNKNLSINQATFPLVKEEAYHPSLPREVLPKIFYPLLNLDRALFIGTSIRLITISSFCSSFNWVESFSSNSVKDAVVILSYIDTFVPPCSTYGEFPPRVSKF